MQEPKFKIGERVRYKKYPDIYEVVKVRYYYTVARVDANGNRDLEDTADLNEEVLKAIIDRESESYNEEGAASERARTTIQQPEEGSIPTPASRPRPSRLRMPRARRAEPIEVEATPTPEGTVYTPVGLDDTFSITTSADEEGPEEGARPRVH